MKQKMLAAAYLAAAMALCLFPLAGLLWHRSGESSENRVLSKFPRLRTEEGWNPEFLSEAGTYFEEHFAYRQELVTADALLRGNLFGVSTADGVIKGTDGWLYYRDSLDDYLGQNTLSERGIFNIARSLRLMQDYVEKNGRTFLFTVAPNKNSLYGEHMPYYDQVGTGEARNIDRLEDALRTQGVHYADLFDVFEKQDQVLYHKRDSHWNNQGAALAMETLLDAVGKDHASYADADYTVRTDFEGDLDKMLYPAAVTPEEEVYYSVPFTYEYEGEVESNFDPEIETSSPQGEGQLLMYRDSFGNALLPFLAEEFAGARFTRGVPYYPDDMFFSGADTVIVERAERFLPDMAKNPPMMQAPEAGINLVKIFRLEVGSEEDASCEMSDEGMYMRFSGQIDERFLDTDSLIYVSVNREHIYEAFPASLERAEPTDDSGETTATSIANEPETDLAGTATENAEGAADNGEGDGPTGVLTEGSTAASGSDGGYVACIGKELLPDSELNIEVYVETDGEFQKVEQAQFTIL